jgi:alpha-tubulin suppressor-like RCC1 family protein
MMWGETRKSRAIPAPSTRPAAAWGMVRVAVSVLAGLAVTVTAAPALAAQHPARLAGTGQHSVTSRIHPGPQWIHVAPGDQHTCATRANGTLWCWGDNTYGELGIGNQTGQDRPRPVTTPAAGGWADVTAGGNHSCAIRANGTLWCWGDNTYGELGIGNQTGQDRPRPVTTPAAGGWANVTAGGNHSCAIRANGTLWCWGRNETGQLGIGNQNNQNLPRQVTTPAPGGWASVTAGGGDYTCAIRSGGTLWCWGFNDYGQLGHGSPDPAVLPLQVTTPALRGWASVTTGGDHTCAIRTNRALWCWGLNNSGQLGLGYYTEGPGVGMSIPQQVISPAAAGWATIAGGGAHTCAIRAGGSLWCWGWNDRGQLGLGNLTYETDLAQQVTGCRPAASQHPALSRPGH